jgi:hypothetical protein
LIREVPVKIANKQLILKELFGEQREIAVTISNGLILWPTLC